MNNQNCTCCVTPTATDKKWYRIVICNGCLDGYWLAGCGELKVEVKK